MIGRVLNLCFCFSLSCFPSSINAISLRFQNPWYLPVRSCDQDKELVLRWDTFPWCRLRDRDGRDHYNWCWFVPDMVNLPYGLALQGIWLVASVCEGRVVPLSHFSITPVWPNSRREKSSSAISSLLLASRVRIRFRWGGPLQPKMQFRCNVTY